MNSKLVLWQEKIMVKRVANCADKIFTVSHSIAKELVDELKIDSAKIKVIYPGLTLEAVQNSQAENSLLTKILYYWLRGSSVRRLYW